MPSDKKFRKEFREQERGNVLFMILIAIAVLAMLTYALSQDSTQQSGVLPQQTSADQINRMLTYASALGGALQQMVTNGEDPNALCTNLSTVQPGGGGFDTAPNNFKIYHPLGGGITPMANSSPDANAVATFYWINTGSSIAGVGCTPGSTTTGSCNDGSGSTACTTGSCTACTGHIVFTALISALSYCQQANQIVNGSTAVPTMNSSAFASLFASHTTVAVTAANCALCVNVARLCVTDGGGNYGFYADLFPPQWINSQ